MVETNFLERFVIASVRTNDIKMRQERPPENAEGNTRDLYVCAGKLSGFARLT
jgi:hypothetical protein